MIVVRRLVAVLAMLALLSSAASGVRVAQAGPLPCSAGPAAIDLVEAGPHHIAGLPADSHAGGHPHLFGEGGKAPLPVHGCCVAACCPLLLPMAAPLLAVAPSPVAHGARPAPAIVGIAPARDPPPPRASIRVV